MKFLNSYTCNLKSYEVRCQKNLFRGSNFVQKFGPSYKNGVKGSNSQSEADILRKIIKKLSTICADSAAHTTIKFISLNGLGNLYLPSEADDLIQSNTIATSLLELFISVLESNTDDLILSEALQSTQRVISNLPTLPLAPHRKTFFDAVFQKGPTFCIVQRRYLEICKHSSFF